MPNVAILGLARPRAYVPAGARALACGAFLAANIVAASTAQAAPHPAAASGVTSASTLVARAMADAGAQKGVVYRSVATQGTSSNTTVVDAGHDEGTSTQVLSQGNLRGHLSIVDADGPAYVKGDSLGLQGVGLTPKASRSQAGYWLVVRPGGSSRQLGDLLHLLTATMTVPSVVSAMGLGQPARAGTATVDGEATVRLTGVSTANAGPQPTKETLYVRAVGVPLPVMMVLGGAPSVTVTFRDWGRAPVVHAPRGARLVRAPWLSKT